MDFIDHINTLIAALTEKDKEYYTDIQNKANVKQRYDHIFGSDDRIFITDERLKSSQVVDLQPLKVKNKIIDYNKDIDEINKILDADLLLDTDKTYTINAFNYVSGYFVENDKTHKPTGRKIKFNSIIDKLIKDIMVRVDKIDHEIRIHEAHLDDNDRRLFMDKREYYTNYVNQLEEIKKNFISYRPSKAILNKNFYVVISRSAEDIAGMSTDRRWTSCMHLPGYKTSTGEIDEEGGLYYKILKNDVELGTLVAYLIDEDDYNNKAIDAPWARIAIKPWFEKDNNKYILVPESRVYTDTSLLKETQDTFATIVNEFADSTNKDSEGIFSFPYDLYRDDLRNGDPKYVIKNKNDRKYVDEIYQLIQQEFIDSQYKQTFKSIKENIYAYYFDNKIDWLLQAIHDQKLESVVLFEYEINQIKIIANNMNNLMVNVNDNKTYNFEIDTGISNCRFLGSSYMEIKTSTVKDSIIDNENLRLTAYEIFASSEFRNGLFIIKNRAKNWDISSKWVNGKLYSMAHDEYITISQKDKDIFNVDVFDPIVFNKFDNWSTDVLKNAIENKQLKIG